MTNFLWFQFLTCEDFILSFVLVNWISLNFGPLVRQTEKEKTEKTEDITFNCRKLTLVTNFWHFIDQMIYHKNKVAD